MAKQKINSDQSALTPAYTEFAYASGWSSYQSGWGAAGYTKTPDGVVVLTGLIKNSSGATKAQGNVIFTLPAGYRPSINKRFAVVYGGGGASIAAYLDIVANGTAYISSNSITLNEWVSVSGVTFLAEA